MPRTNSFKVKLSLLAALTLIFSAGLAQAQKPGAYYLGDADGNGIIEIPDLSVLAGVLGNPGQPDPAVYAGHPQSRSRQELDGNGLIEVPDYSILLNWVTGNFSNRPGNPDQLALDGDTHLNLDLGDSVTLSAYALSPGSAGTKVRTGFGVIFKLAPSSTCASAQIYGYGVAGGATVNAWRNPGAYHYTLQPDAPDNGRATVRVNTNGCSAGQTVVVEVYIPDDIEAGVVFGRFPDKLSAPHLITITVQAVCTDIDADDYYGQTGCGTAVDCDDNNPDIHPGAAELMDGIDNQCPGDFGYGYIDEIYFESESFESGTIPDGWFTAGDANWFVSGGIAADGVYSARSGDIGNMQVTVLWVTAINYSFEEICFSRAVFSQSGSDFLGFTIDDEYVDSWSGVITWDQFCYPITPGIHKYEWYYVKDDAGSSSLDAGLIDHVYLTSDGCTDLDKDGFYAQEGCGTLVDCDDGNWWVHPGLSEFIDGIDNQCPGDFGYGYIDEIYFESESFESLILQGWFSDGDFPWFVTDLTAVDGTYSFQSGAITHDGYTYLRVTAINFTFDEVCFYRMVSSEEGFDYLYFTIDGLFMDSWSGEAPWAQVCYPITPGIHQYYWEYYKNGSGSSGSDAAWVDFVVFSTGGCHDPDNDGFYGNSGCGTAVDCNNHNPDVYPGAAELMDGMDNQCPGDFGYGYIDEVYFASESFESGIPPGWFTGGDADWSITDATAADGVYSYLSGLISDDQLTELWVSSINYSFDEVCFYRMVSSEAGADYLFFNIDTSFMDAWSGNEPWTMACYAITPGIHQYSWIYSKNGSGSSGFDVALIDYIVFSTGVCHDPDSDGYYGISGCGTAVDCNNNNPDIFPGAPELMDELDNQCPGDFGYGYIDEIFFTSESFESGNPAGWFSGGDADWFITDATAADGIYSYQSGPISDDQYAELWVSAINYSFDQVCFYRTVSSEAGGDSLSFYIDGWPMNSWSGEIPWGQACYLITSGIHHYSWVYAKNDSISEGADAAWVDYVNYAQFPGTWVATPTVDAPSARYAHTAVWTGTEMIIWGGWDLSWLNTGGRYNPSTDSWTATTTTDAPAERYGHSAVWTGTEMIVWGGVDINYDNLNTGGRYDPSTDSWTDTTTTDAPAARALHTAIWTGTRMVVWGGYDGSALNTGGRYDPSTDSWTATNTANAPSARCNHTSVWTETEMIVWGGEIGGSSYTNTGGRYNPATDSWNSTNTFTAPAARYKHTAVWTGTEMIVWGGSSGSTYLNTGGRYNPATDSWNSTNTLTAPSARYKHAAVWTGALLIVWGGSNATSYLGDGGRYDPGTDSWNATTNINAPGARGDHTAVWAGTEMIIWGGHYYTNTGGRYLP